MITSGLMHDHTRPLKKPRTCFIVLRFDADKVCHGIGVVVSNKEKAEKWISENRLNAASFETVRHYVQ